MTTSSAQLEALEHYKDIYEQAVADKNGLHALAIIDRLKSLGFKQEAQTLLDNTRVLDLVTPSSRSTWETDNPTQETL